MGSNINKIKYSIVIPHYNNESGLERLLDSIPARDDIQVIVVDDKSDTENSKEIVLKHNLPNKIYRVNDRVKSAGTCRNIGLELAVGEYLIFSDSDDFFTLNAFDKIDAFIGAQPDCDLYYFNVTSIDDQQKLTTRHIKFSDLARNYVNEKTLENALKIRLTHNVPWGKVLKRRLVTESNIVFDETLVSNDGMFSTKVGKQAQEIAVSLDTIYCVTLRHDSLTRTDDAPRFRTRLEVYVRYYHYLSREERKIVGASPLPFLYISRRYGLPEVIRSIIFLKKNRVAILSNFKLSKSKLKVLLKIK